MTLCEHFHAALAPFAVDLPGAALLLERLARAAAQVLPVHGAGIGLFFLSDRQVPVGASDPVSAEAERLEFTVGEGPCLSAHAHDEPVVADEATLDELAERVLNRRAPVHDLALDFDTSR